MNYEEFLLLNFNNYKSQKILKMENYDEIYQFYKIRYNRDFKPFYHCNPIFNTISNTNNFRYIIIELNNDKILIMYKIIQIMKTKQIRIFDKPISIDKNENNEKIINNHLEKLDFIKFVKMGEKPNENYKSLYYYNDYYYDFSNSKRKFNSEFRAKNGINRILKNKDYELITYNGMDEQDAINIREIWLEEKDVKVSSKKTKDFSKFSTYRDENLIQLVLKYKKEIISVQIFYLDKKKKFADCLFISHRGREKTEDFNLHQALRHMTYVQLYFAKEILEKYGIYKLYVAGGDKDNKSLFKHKEETCDGKIEYWISE